jgi:hypothetical protein
MTAIILALSVMRAVGAAQAGDPRLRSLSSLTIRGDRLPTGCSLPPSIFAIAARATNPWSGTDPVAIGEIRERVDGPTRMPDGPPLSHRELARFRFSLAEGVEEGYAAVYQQDEQKKNG